MAGLSLIGGTIGVLICLYAVLFRWKAVVAEYGRHSLYWWLIAITVECSLVGYYLGLAVWVVRYAIWRASH